ncbi:hypothetical protein Bra1253DRAFT_00187 [Bradyrhizobium sp. WSM1253]|nr:hypothetical protein Bra1253DRAFT_00187 [Bradyrhizobium sp. WSM1253]
MSGLAPTTVVLNVASMFACGPRPVIGWVGIPSNPSYNRIQSGSRAMAQERQGRVERRLAAILAADVDGYSRLLHRRLRDA